MMCPVQCVTPLALWRWVKHGETGNPRMGRFTVYQFTINQTSLYQLPKYVILCDLNSNLPVTSQAGRNRRMYWPSVRCHCFLLNPLLKQKGFTLEDLAKVTSHPGIGGREWREPLHPEFWGRIDSFFFYMFSTEDFALLGSLPLETWTLSLARRVVVLSEPTATGHIHSSWGTCGRSFGTQQASKAWLAMGLKTWGHSWFMDQWIFIVNFTEHLMINHEILGYHIFWNADIWTYVDHDGGRFSQTFGQLLIPAVPASLSGIVAATSSGNVRQFNEELCNARDIDSNILRYCCCSWPRSSRGVKKRLTSLDDISPSNVANFYGLTLKVSIFTTDKDCHDAVTPGAWTPGAAVRCPMCEAHAGSGCCQEQELVCCGTYWVVAAPLARSCWNVWWLRFGSRELVLGLRDCGYSFSSFCIFTNVFFVSFCVFLLYIFSCCSPNCR